jgi:hypothetical protein
VSVPANDEAQAHLHLQADQAVTLAAIGTGGLAILVCIAFSISWYASRQRRHTVRRGQNVSHTALSRADSTMSKQTELFGSPMPSTTPTPYSAGAMMTPSTGSTLVATPDMAYIGPGMRKEGYDKGGKGRAPFMRQNSDNRSPLAGRRERAYSATTDGRGSVVVITYEEGLAEMGRHGLVSPARSAVAKVDSVIRRAPTANPTPALPSVAPSARPTVASYNQPAIATARTEHHPFAAPVSPTFGARSNIASPVSALPTHITYSTPPPPLRPHRPSVTRKTRQKGVIDSPADISDNDSADEAQSTSQSDRVPMRNAKGRDGLEQGHGMMPPEGEWERDGDEVVTFDEPQSAFLPSYYQPAGERRKTRTRGGKI